MMMEFMTIFIFLVLVMAILKIIADNDKAEKAEGQRSTASFFWLLFSAACFTMSIAFFGV